MERRKFVKAVMAGGVLGASPLASRAASELFSPHRTQPVMIVSQAGLPQATALVAQLKQELVAAGMEHAQAALTASELGTFERVTALLGQVSGKRLIGVMDDAAAVIFQEIAAARAATCVVSTHHRFTFHEVRHCCTSAGFGTRIAWSDSLSAHAQRVGRLYVGLVGGQPFAADPGSQIGAALRVESLDGAPASLVSFLVHA